MTDAAATFVSRLVEDLERVPGLAGPIIRS